MASVRAQALSLYRRLLRAARTWQGSAEESEYIRQEARQQFRANRNNPDGGKTASLLEEGEKRLELAQHYGIAYPRLHHADQFEKVPYVQPPKLEEEAESVARGIKDQGIATKLEAAARRRKERLTQQRQQQQQDQLGGDGEQQAGR